MFCRPVSRIVVAEADYMLDSRLGPAAPGAMDVAIHRRERLRGRDGFGNSYPVSQLDVAIHRREMHVGARWMWQSIAGSSCEGAVDSAIHPAPERAP